MAKHWDMTPEAIKERYGATHYITMKDDVTPQLFYKLETTPVNDGTKYTSWVYLTYADLWHGSNIKVGSEEEKRLVAI